MENTGKAEASSSENVSEKRESFAGKGEGMSFGRDARHRKESKAKIRLCLQGQT